MSNDSRTFGSKSTMVSEGQWRMSHPVLREDPSGSDSPDPSAACVRITLRPIPGPPDSLQFEPISFQLISGGASVRFFRDERQYGPSFKDNQVKIGSRVISRNGHAQIWYEEDSIYVQDTGSSSGTWINHNCLAVTPRSISHPYKVIDGDIVRLGQDVTQSNLTRDPNNPAFKCFKARILIERIHSETLFGNINFNCESNCQCPWRQVFDSKDIYPLASSVRGPKSILHALNEFMNQPSDTLTGQWVTWTEAEAEAVLFVIHRIQASLQGSTEDEKLCLSFTRKIARQTGVLPTTFALSGVEKGGEHPVSCGGFADIYKGTYQGKYVAIKTLRTTSTREGERNKLHKDIIHEALFWKNLDHPHILPFLGLKWEADHSRLSLISPWMPNGHILEFLNKYPRADKLWLLWQAAHGLAYLHECHLTHGDVKGANILVDVDGTIRISDFGLISLSETQTLATTSTTSKGSLRWMAPELLTPGHKRGKSSDIYAFGITIVEVYTGERPFQTEGYSDIQTIMAVSDGYRPKRPTLEQDKDMRDQLWSLACQCWDHAIFARPNMHQVVKELDSQLVGDRRLRRGTTLTPAKVNAGMLESLADVDSEEVGEQEEKGGLE